MKVTRDGGASVTLPSDEEILVTREFDSPRHLLYRAWTTPDLVGRWWTGGRGTMRSAEIDLRVGGGWRYVMETRQGDRVAFHGRYQEIVPAVRLVYSEVFETRPHIENRTVVSFESLPGGGTRLLVLTRFENQQERDVHHSYMNDGLQAALKTLDEVASCALSTR